MPTPPPDPNDRQPPASAEPGSTESHRSEAPLSDLIKGGSSVRRPPSVADIAAHISGTHAALGANTDDQPTVITPPGSRTPPPPPLVVVGGDPPSVAGRRLGHFELIEAIGAGGMAAVLKARDLELGRVVALKILPPEAAHDPENVTRFKQEARAAAKLDHDNVARVYFCGEDQGLHFIAFEFVEGETLRARIDRRGTLPPAECVRCLIQIAAGLGHAADRGVVHRDIKPSNVLLTPDGRAKIVDMGLARHLESGSVNGGVTHSGVTLGTFDYISPEQALDPRQADTRSDIYSLGCTFYHALTGRPPVPEGTAAKKLQAHQHGEPTDPRQINPDVPDELAAVLARMMAKNPADRYQTPADLIAHLKGVAERMHLPADGLLVDSLTYAVPAELHILPDPPKVRLGWVAVAAAVVVAAVALVVSSGPSNHRAAPPWATDTGNKKDETLAGTPGGPPAPGTGLPVAADGSVTVRTAEELARALADPRVTRVALAGGTFDLTRLPQGATFAGDRAIELSGSAAQTTRIRLLAAPFDPANPARPGTLTFARAETVAIHRVKFDLVTPDRDTEPAAGPVGLAALDVGRLELTDCAFLPDATARAAGVTAVLVARTGDEPPPKVALERCLFGPGAVGVELPARSEVTIADSGFAPHFAAVHVRPDGEPDPAKPTTVALDRSTFMLDAVSAVVEADDPLPVRVTAGYCVFAPVGGVPAEAAVPGMPGTGRRGAVVRVAGAKPEIVQFAGHPDRRNAYYRVDPIATSVKGYSFDDCKAMTPCPADDPGRVNLPQRPWDGVDPVSHFATPDPYRALRLKLTEPALLVADRDPRVIGAQFATTRGHRVYADIPWPPEVPRAVADTRTKIWFPEAKPNEPLPAGTYTDLLKLLRDARSGDEILIRHTGPLPMEPATIQPPAKGPDRGDFRLTIKAEPGSKPVLALIGGNNDFDATLFKVKDGRVTFEGLHFVVKPAGPRNHRSVAGVTVLAGRGCAFRSCTFTLEEDEAKAVAVAVADPTNEMKMDPAAARVVPKVEFENCLIRGKGRGVWVPVSRPMELDLTNTVVGLDGPVVLTEPATKDPGGAARSQVRFTRVTALLGGSLIELHGGRGGLVPVDVDAEECVFAAVPGAGKPVVELSGIDPTDADRFFTWKAGKPNRYANFDAAATVALIRPLGEDITQTKTWGWNTWLEFAHEVGRPVGRVTFADPPAGLKDLATLDPADVRVTDVDFPDLTWAKPADAGATVRDVPKPPGE